MLNPNEAPDGYVAEISSLYCLACDIVVTLTEDCPPCTKNERKDQCNVIFKKKEDKNESMLQ